LGIGEINIVTDGHIYLQKINLSIIYILYEGRDLDLREGFYPKGEPWFP